MKLLQECLSSGELSYKLAIIPLTRIDISISKPSHHYAKMEREAGEREREKELHSFDFISVCVHRDAAIPRVHFFGLKSNKTREDERGKRLPTLSAFFIRECLRVASAELILPRPVAAFLMKLVYNLGGIKDR